MIMYIQVRQNAGRNSVFTRQPAFQTLFTLDEKTIMGGCLLRFVTNGCTKCGLSAPGWGEWKPAGNGFLAVLYRYQKVMFALA
ncbi:hypothetical protein ACIPIN_06190 [Pseudomonas sp. NPDC087697]|uniref:hypothetical protein n=1 Tax=Pseudomonas sp. NPDC087697 TaxID=3364447 RepID=UPI003817230D